ncbi:hypothetical protein [Pseudoalteromonas rubra]|uniref:Uncharacterized protein n=1 Tax=Pseudoalteromonas rubra TaxID=43658 RepID=A0A0U3HIM5_9GAMM|nr:hypothetical protein [Pseudoalteromonas rubra]ALU42821.1 hypothetical protein AT705_07565 [Pseudoalteromonas rubra]
MANRLSILFVFLSFLIINCSMASEFKQAYAPIYVSVKPDSAGDTLVWTAARLAKYYRIEQFVDGKWEMVNANVSGTRYTMPATASGVYRVTACDEYGCAVAKQQNRVVSEPFSVKAFYSNRSQVDDYGLVEVSWQVSGAATVSIMKSTQDGATYSWNALNPTQGTLKSHLSSMSSFTLTAHDFGGKSTSRVLSIATLPENPVELNGVKGSFLQPLFLSGLDVVERSVLEYEDNLYFATHGGRLHRYSVTKEAGKIIDWHGDWDIPLAGVVNSAPVIDGDKLIFTMSMRNGKGKVCSAFLADGKMHSCSEEKSSNVLASPVIINQAPSSNLSAVSTFFTESRNVENGVYVFQRDGLIQVLDPSDLSIVLNEYRIGGVSAEFINTPSLITDDSGERQQFIMQNSENEIFGVDVPTRTVPSTISNTMNQWFGSEQTQTPSTNNQIQILPVVWREKL